MYGAVQKFYHLYDIKVCPEGGEGTQAHLCQGGVNEAKLLNPKKSYYLG